MYFFFSKMIYANQDLSVDVKSKFTKLEIRKISRDNVREKLSLHYMISIICSMLLGHRYL